MNALEITYKGQGSEKQVSLATDIFNAEIKKIQDAYDYAMLRVDENTMPQKWADHWASVLSDERTIKAINAFANQPASVTIEYKGLRGPRGSMSIAKAVEKIVISTYQE